MGEEDEVMAVVISRDSMVSKGEMVRRCRSGRAWFRKARWCDAAGVGGHVQFGVVVMKNTSRRMGRKAIEARVVVGH